MARPGKLLELWMGRAQLWLLDDPVDALRRMPLIDILLSTPPGFQCAGDERAIVVSHEPSLIPSVAFEADDAGLLWRLLRQLVGLRRPAVAVVDDAARQLLRRIALIEIELPRVQMLLPADSRVAAQAAVALIEPGHPAVMQLIHAVGGLSLAPANADPWYGIWSAGQLLAAGTASTRWPGLGEICNVITHPDHRRQGYATAVVSTIARMLQDAGRLPFLEVFPGNEAALTCYQRLGFLPCHQLWRSRFLLGPKPDTRGQGAGNRGQGIGDRG